jgi:hypothetical protein
MDFLDLEEFAMYMELDLVFKSSPSVFEIEPFGFDSRFRNVIFFYREVTILN